MFREPAMNFILQRRHFSCMLTLHVIASVVALTLRLRLRPRSARSVTPLRRIDFENTVEKSAHDEIVRLVEKMLALQKERQSVRREDDLDRVRNLEKQITQVDAEIDQRVYGLTEEEIRIVEGR